MVEIQIVGYGNLELDTKISDDFGIQMVYTIDDIKNPGSRKTSYSKTIKVIGNDNNNKIFNHLYEIKGLDFSYKFNKNYECILIVDNNPIVHGYIVLNKIYKTLIESRYEIVYELNIIQQLKSIFDELDKKKLSDLDFSSGFTFQGTTYRTGDFYNVPYRIPEHFDLTADPKMVTDYGLIDYGYKTRYLYDFPYFTLSKGIVYPSVYVKALWDRIFYELGYTYTSKFISGELNDGMFNNLVLMYNREKSLNDIEFSEYNATYNIVYGSGNVSDYDDGRLITVFISSTHMNSIDHNYYEIDSYYSNPGFLESSSDISICECVNSLSGMTTYSGNTYKVNKGAAATGTVIPADGDYRVKLRIEVKKDEGGLYNNNNLYPTLYDIVKYTPPVDKTTNGSFEVVARYTSYQMRQKTNQLTSWYYEEYSNWFSASENDILLLHIKPGKKQGVQINVEIDGTSVESIFKTKDEDDKEIIKISDIVPDMTQGDFIRNMMKMFNLYIGTDKNNSKNIYIEPRDEFYNTDYIVWDDKIDYNKEIVSTNLLDYIGKEVSFKYKIGKDYKSKDYKDEYNKGYGNKLIYPDGDYRKDKTETNLDFQSYLLNDQDTGRTFLFTFNFPSLYKDIDHTYYDDRMELEPMIGFISFRYLGGYRFANYTVSGVRNHSINWIKIIQNVKVIGGQSYDLNYSVEDLSFINLQNYQSGNTLYNIFWKNHILNLIDDDSRFVELYVKLDLNDIMNLDFRKKIILDGQIYYLYKLEYDFTKRISSKITLLKEVNPIYTPEYGQFYKSFLLKNDNGEYIITDDDRDRIII